MKHKNIILQNKLFVSGTIGLTKDERLYFKKRLKIGSKTGNPFVEKGTVFGFELKNESNGKVIPEGEQYISTLIVADNGRIYGGTSGKKCHFFYFDRFFFTVDICSFKGYNDIPCITTAHSEIVTGCAVDRKNMKSIIFEYDTSLDYASIYGQVSCGVPVIKGSPLTGIQIESVFPVSKNEYLCISSNPVAVFVYNSHTNRISAKVFKDNSRQVVGFVKLPGSNLAFSCAGRIFMLNTETKIVKVIVKSIPCSKGKMYSESISAMTVAGNSLYCGTESDGYLFELKLDSGKIINHGVPTSTGGIACISESKNGIIYGCTDGNGGFGHLFSFNPLTNEIEDLGILLSSMLHNCICGRPGASVCGVNGEIIIGERERLSCLYVYYPHVSSCYKSVIKIKR